MNRAPHRAAQSGFILITVLGVLAILTVIALGFAHRALLDRRAARLSADHAEALHMARGAVWRGVAQLQNQHARRGLLQRPGRPASTGLDWLRRPDPIGEGLFRIEPGSGDTVDYLIRDLDGRISLNAAPEALLEAIDFLNARTVREILERREDDARTGRRPFLVLEELRTIQDLDDDEWYGDDEHPGVTDLLTPWGDHRINLNTAPEEVLRLVPGARDDAVLAIVNYRRGPDGRLGTADDRTFDDFADVSRLTGLSAERVSPFALYCKLESRFFTITGFATRRQGRVRALATAVVELRNGVPTVLQWREGPLES